MSTYKANHHKQDILFYTLASISTMVIGTVYECFSHQVYSPFMYLLFLIPLLLGLAPNLLDQNFISTSSEQKMLKQPTAPS